MSKAHKRIKSIKALPVCSPSIKAKCAVYLRCINIGHCAPCPAFDENEKIHRCKCGENFGHGCPYFRKAGDK